MEARLAYLNPSDPAPEKRLSSDSRPLRNVAVMTYTLPIGRGKKFDMHNRVADFLVGGWLLSNVYTLQSGPVLTWGDYNYIYYGGPLNLQNNQPNRTAFNIAQFNAVSTQQLADNIETLDLQFNNLRRNHTSEIDTSMDKKFQFAERKYIQIRLVWRR